MLFKYKQKDDGTGYVVASSMAEAMDSIIIAIRESLGMGDHTPIEDPTMIEKIADEVIINGRYEEGGGKDDEN